MSLLCEKCSGGLNRAAYFGPISVTARRSHFLLPHLSPLNLACIPAKLAGEALILRLLPKCWFPCLHHFCLPDALISDHTLIALGPVSAPLMFSLKWIRFDPNPSQEPRKGQIWVRAGVLAPNFLKWARNGLKYLKKCPWFNPRCVCNAAHVLLPHEQAWLAQFRNGPMGVALELSRICARARGLGFLTDIQAAALEQQVRLVVLKL
eukprot:1137084-Pelagomonas_calceolata.AAC.2